jgi:hypothetical protein
MGHDAGLRRAPSTVQFIEVVDLAGIDINAEATQRAPGKNPPAQ